MKNKPWLMICSIATMGSFLFLVSPLTAISEADTAASPSETVEYVIEDIQGPNVQVLEEGQAQWEPAEEGQVVDSGDEVKVGHKSEANLMLESETSVHLNEDSDMKVDQVAPNEKGGFLSRLKVIAGLVLADVKKNLQDSHSTFEVESNGVICGVRGTAFEVNAQDGNSQVATHEGKVEVSGGGESHMVTAGNLSSFKAGKFQLQRRLDRSEIQRFQKWRAHRQLIEQKHTQRLLAIKNHTRQPWQRKHPLPNKPAVKLPVQKPEMGKKPVENKKLNPLKRKPFRKKKQ